MVHCRGHALSSPFPLYTSDFQYNSESCHIQKFTDDTGMLGCIRNRQEEKYVMLIHGCHFNHLHLNTTKTKEMVMDLSRPGPHSEFMTIKEECVEIVQTYKWTSNTNAQSRKGQSQLYFRRRLVSFNIFKKKLQIFY